MGPLANQRRCDAIEELVRDAVEKGALIRSGGTRLRNEGYFFAPTVLSDVPTHARAMDEEPFGPLALINPYETIDDAIEEANRLPFGLAAYAFTRSINIVSQLGSAPRDRHAEY